MDCLDVDEAERLASVIQSNRDEIGIGERQFYPFVDAPAAPEVGIILQG